MKFRSSFQISREPREDGTAPSTPFNISSLRNKKSKTFSRDELEEQDIDDVQCTPKWQDIKQDPDSDPQKASSRKQAMQDFFRNTQANLKTTGSSIKARSAKLPQRMTARKARVGKQQPASKRNSMQMRSLDIDNRVLDKLMGPPKPEAFGSGKIQSPNFLLKQRIRASSSRAAASTTYISPLLTPARSQAELDRKPLGVEEIQEMFAGAPHFNVEKLEGGGYRPQVIFRGGDTNQSARYGRDYESLGHSSFEASTLGLHRTRETATQIPSGQSHGTNDSSKAGDSLLEVPSMLSANGLDPGTIGYEHFLQLPIADSTALPDEPNFFDKRKLLYSQPERLGLRELNMEVIIDRLTELGELHAAKAEQQPWSERKTEEMGEDLFARLLDSELGTTGAGTGSVTMRTQIEALQKVLNKTELWHDFSQVEWRIRVGQLLWTNQEDEELQLDEDRQPSEKDVLLLQITLAAELLVRLNALKTIENSDISMPAPDGDASAPHEQSRKLKWDLLLAETFLENLTVSAKIRDGSSKAGNRSSLFSAISFLTAKETPEEADEAVQPLLFPKNEERQLAGLLYFAEAIGWPHAQDVQSELEAKLTAPAREPASRQDVRGRPVSQRPVSGATVYATPLSSPGFPPSTYAPSILGNRNSYFGGLSVQQKSNRPGVSRMTTASSMQLLAASSPHPAASPEAFEVGGWLSRSWLTGLVLPGEPASHFLISTLLENSPQAIAALGDSANLYGGFVYAGRSFWSKSCVVGRVMAAMRGAKECMGWVSVPGVPEGWEGEGWVELDVNNVPASSSLGMDGEARIKADGRVGKDSDPLHGTSLTAVQAGEFTTPHDGPPVMGNEVRSHGLSFTPSQSSYELAKAQIQTPGAMEATSTSTAHMTFSSPLNPKLARLEVPLTYDVHFIASYPCHPSPQQRSPTSKVSSPSDVRRGASVPDFAFPETDDFLDAKSTHPADSARASSAANSGMTLSLKDIEKDLPPPPAHPLHIDYHFDVVPVATLLSAPPETGRVRALSVPGDRLVKSTGGVSGAEEVIVLDCRGTQDLELLARAWCAKVGENALVGKSGRTCLACCVREARALGVGVVLRT